MHNLSKETINVERIGKTKEFGVGRVKKYKFYLHMLLNSKFPISADKRVNINHCKLNTNMNATLFFVLSLFKYARMYLFITEFIVMILVHTTREVSSVHLIKDRLHIAACSPCPK